jgi:hypothetical protein
MSDTKDILLKSKFRFGPMSLNIVDTIIDFCNLHKLNLTFIPSRRQVEYNGGYVNNWTIKEFSEYVKSKTKYMCIQCDHAGPAQGSTDDDGLRSLEECCLYYDSIHIDPFKKYPQLHDAINHTIQLIKYCYAMFFKKKYWTDYNTVEFLSWSAKAIIIIPGLIFKISLWYLFFLTLFTSLALIWASNKKLLPTLVGFNTIWVWISCMVLSQHLIK